MVSIQLVVLLSQNSSGVTYTNWKQAKDLVEYIAVAIVDEPPTEDGDGKVDISTFDHRRNFKHHVERNCTAGGGFYDSNNQLIQPVLIFHIAVAQLIELEKKMANKEDGKVGCVCQPIQPTPRDSLMFQRHIIE